jgi:hypothetical protein
MCPDADRRVTVKLDAKVKEWGAEKGYDPVFGAFPQTVPATSVAKAGACGRMERRGAPNRV